MVNVPQQYVPLLQQMSQSTGIPYNVLAAQANAESGFNATAQSPTGALGWLQFEPQTYATVASQAGVSPSSEFDPASEAKAYNVYMRQLLSQEGGDLKKALEAYNAGPGNLTAGASYANSILASANSPDITVANTASFNPLNPLGSVGGSLVTDAVNQLLKMLGLGSLKDMVERLGLILLGVGLIFLGIHVLSSGGSSQPFNINVDSKESGGTKTTTRKVKTPLGSHTSSIESAGKTGAGAATEAAIAA